VDTAWAEQNCPLQSPETIAAIVASGLCPAHVQQRFGADVTKRGKPLAPPVQT